MRMAAAGDDEEYYLRHDQGVLGIPAAFPYAFALEERPEGDQVEAAVAEELGYGGGPGALDMMHLDEVAYWLLDLHVLDPLFDDPHGGGGDEDATASVSTITAEISIAGDHERMLLPAEIADWDIDQWLLQVHHDLGAADPHGDDDSTATSTAAAESWADGGGWEMQIDKSGDEEEEWVLRGHGTADDAATATTAESRVGGDDHRLQPYACDCAAAAGDPSVECWWVPEPSTGPLPDQLALDGDVFLQDLVLGDMQQLLV